MERFSRVINLLGNDNFEKIRNAHVTVVGLGAVGSYATEALVRFGVSNLRLVDFDKVSKSNINRQLYALESTLGMQKADVAKMRILDINPSCNVEALHLFLDDKTVDFVLSNSPDVVIDAIDSLSPKVHLIKELYFRKIKAVSSMGAALRKDPSKIKCSDIFDTSGCRLAYKIRKRLRKFGVGRGIKCVYSDEEGLLEIRQTYKENGEEDSFRGRSRFVLGSLPTITGIFGLNLAHEAINIILEN
jgi:tRNA A37 threonylcarbamoyladenosine dehydratase